MNHLIAAGAAEDLWLASPGDWRGGNGGRKITRLTKKKKKVVYETEGEKIPR